MKRIFTILLIILASNNSFGQTENYSNAIDKFKTNYNAGKYGEIFNDFAPVMKNTLPLEKTKQALSGFKTQAGNIQHTEFINYQKGFAVYKTKFEKVIFSINIALNDKNKINGLFFKPYKEVNKNENEAINSLSKYPKKITEIIFSEAKDFPNNTQISIALTRNGKTIYYGIIKENDTIKSIENENKIFEIGSITKVFTSTILASLVEDKKIKLTDYINAYYPFTFKDNNKLSFKSLANHTSGLPRLPENLDLSNKINPYKNYSKKELDEYLKNILKLENKTSKTYSYSNLGAGLLGYTLGLSQKTNFQELLQKKIFDKYKMTNSYTSSQKLGNKLVKGLNSKGETVSNWDFNILFGAGGILSTTEDLTKFAKAQFNPKNKVLTLTRKPTFTVNDNMKIGLGWHILKSKNDKELIWHNGGTGGYSSSMAVNVDDKTAVIILSNVSTFNPKMKNIDKLCFELIRTVDDK